MQDNESLPGYQNQNQFMGPGQNHQLLLSPSQQNHEKHASAKMQGGELGKVKKTEGRGVQDNPEYFRVDLQTGHKLYEVYRRLRVGALEDGSFQQKQQGCSTVNYHKIMQIFTDLSIKLEISQKLTILRAIKKFCFNQNFINQQEFIKIYKVIVHGLNFKESIFKGLTQTKYSNTIQKQQQQLFKRGASVSIKLNKNFGKKLKTEPEMQNLRLKYQSQQTAITEVNKTIHAIGNDSSYIKKDMVGSNSRGVEQNKVSTARRRDSRKRMLTDQSRYQDSKVGYLQRAFQKNKLGKVTWQNLFKMNQDSLHHLISIPTFISQQLNPHDLYY